MSPEQRIPIELDRLAAENRVKILYACESGSRAWDFASPDSDFDVRFIFARPAATYLSVRDGMEGIDPTPDPLLDFSGWDLRKALRLLGKSNGPLLEWLHSPQVYREESGFRLRWQALARAVFSPRAAASHYLGLARQMVERISGQELRRAKDELYALRALLAAEWVVERRGIPPVVFAELRELEPPALREEVDALLRAKAASAEDERSEPRPEIDTFLREALQRLGARIQELPDAPPGIAETLDEAFRRELDLLRPPRPRREELSLARVRRHDMACFDAVAGSRAYGTALDGSDEDRRGVFVAPEAMLLGLEPVDQVSDDRGDEVMYEIGRLVELLLKSNPNALELLAMPDDCVRHRHPAYGLLKPEIFLSKACGRTYGEYAMGQVRKARGLNKKIVNPEPEQRRRLLDFCHVPDGQGSMPLLDWLATHAFDPEACGLTAVPHAPGLHAVYHDGSTRFRGLVSRENPDALIYSSVHHDAVPLTWMVFNQNAFEAHCKAHREYWEWVAQRNEERYRTNAEHGRGYDSKNLMHTLRLLEMSLEIAREGVIRVRRPNREELLKIRAGDYGYDELVARAEATLEEAREAFRSSSLPDEPDREAAIEALLEIRAAFR